MSTVLDDHGLLQTRATGLAAEVALARGCLALQGAPFGLGELLLISGRACALSLGDDEEPGWDPWVALSGWSAHAIAREITPDLDAAWTSIEAELAAGRALVLERGPNPPAAVLGARPERDLFVRVAGQQDAGWHALDALAPQALIRVGPAAAAHPQRTALLSEALTHAAGLDAPNAWTRLATQLEHGPDQAGALELFGALLPDLLLARAGAASGLSAAAALVEETGGSRAAALHTAAALYRTVPASLRAANEQLGLDDSKLHDYGVSALLGIALAEREALAALREEDLRAD